MQRNHKLNNLISTREAGRRWGFSSESIKKMCVDGEVEAVRIGNTWIVDADQDAPKRKIAKPHRG